MLRFLISVAPSVDALQRNDIGPYNCDSELESLDILSINSKKLFACVLARALTHCIRASFYFFTRIQVLIHVPKPKNHTLKHSMQYLEKLVNLRPQMLICSKLRQNANLYSDVCLLSR